MAREVIETVNARGVKINGKWVDFAEDYEDIP